MDDDFAQKVVTTWRESNWQVQQFWWDIEKACKQVVRAYNNAKRCLRLNVCGIIVWYDPRDYLCLRLPSGRDLRYYKPILRKDGRWENIFYMDGSKHGAAENYGRINTYSGKLTENIVQAIARDLLMVSMFLVKRAGLDIIFHVHDEVVAEADEDDDKAFGIVHNAMQYVPSWATGLPLEAESYESKRYTK